MSLLLLGAGQPAASSYDPASDALFARFSTDPGATRKGHYNTLIVALKAAGVWSKLDGLWLFGAHNAQAAQRNLIADAYNVSELNSPTFTTDRGYTGDGSSSYLDTNFNRSAGGTNYSRNSASFSAWCRNNLTASNTRYLIGTSNATQFFLRPRNGGGNFDARINATAAPAFASSSSAGFFAGNRSGASNDEIYRDGAQVATGTNASAAISGNEMYFLRTSTSYAAFEIFAGHIGGSLTTTEHTALYDAINTFRVAVGA